MYTLDGLLICLCGCSLSICHQKSVCLFICASLQVSELSSQLDSPFRYEYHKRTHRDMHKWRHTDRWRGTQTDRERQTGMQTGTRNDMQCMDQSIDQSMVERINE
ncbi:uncharacterized protein Smp_201390 [Schistosoma mansoni]|uniref:uncharacterized protein n=1 Tax=Schistosoma mansoni TaxID=6183 RepID=UPI00022DC15B|nr:uncharacterized protein Smp_201390 [Schistosoma mansoni]|eukprot:XP_018649699.1 uncharacterized protein Smp_201390 [Schistosoma mansoni]